MTVAVANAIEVVVLQNPPSPVFVGPLAKKNVLRSLIFVMGAWATRRIEELMARRRQRHVPLRNINFVIWWPVDRVGSILALHHLAGCIRVDVHHVMRIDEVHGHEPRLALRLQFARLCPQPCHCRLRGKIVKRVSAECAVYQVADPRKSAKPYDSIISRFVSSEASTGFCAASMFALRCHLP